MVHGRPLRDSATRTPRPRPALSTLKNDPDLWRQKVRSTRIRDANDPPGSTGVLDLANRKGCINQLTTYLMQRIAVEDNSKKKPMTKGQFIAHERFKEGVLGLETEAAMDQHWANVLAHPDTKILSGHGESAVILVDKGRTLVGKRERSLSTAINRSNTLESQLEADAAMAQLANTGAGSAVFSSAIFGSAAEYFHPGAAHSHGSNSGFGPSAITGAQDSNPLPASLVVPPEDFAPFDTQDQKRELQPVVSDPANPGTKRPRTTKTKARATYATGELKAVQDAAIQQVKDMRAKYVLSKVNPAKMIATLNRQHSTKISNEIKEWAREFQDTLKEVETVSKEIKNWTTMTMEAAKNILDIHQANLQTQSALLMGAINKIKSEIKEGAQQRLKTLRTEMSSREKAIRAFVQLGTPFRFGQVAVC